MMSSLFSTAALPKRKSKNHQASDSTANPTAGNPNKPPYREVLYDNAGSPILAPDADDIIDGLDLPNDSPLHQHLQGTVGPRPNSTWTYSGTTAATTASAPDSVVGEGSKKRRGRRNRKKRSHKGAETQENSASAIESEPDLNTSRPSCSCSSNHANYQQHTPGPLSHQAYKPSVHPFYDPTSKGPHANKVKAKKSKSVQSKEAEDSEKQPVKLRLGLNLKLDLELKAEIEGDITISLS